MSIRLTLAATTLAAALAGCAHFGVGVPVDARWIACDTSPPGARCDVRISRDAGGAYSCALGRFRVDPDYLELRGGRPVNIQWELPDGFVFCDGDGIALKQTWGGGPAQVFENYGSDRKDGARSGFETSAQCKPFRNWRWGNTTPGGTYAYEIRFRNRTTGERCTIDPWIRNL